MAMRAAATRGRGSIRGILPAEVRLYNGAKRQAAARPARHTSGRSSCVTVAAPAASPGREDFRMKMLLPLLLAATLIVPAPPPGVPECTATLTLPDTAQKLELRWRQLPDEPAFHEGQSLDAKGLHAMRVQCLLAQAAQLRTDVPVRVGEVLLAPGTRPLGFTIAAGGAPQFFVADGERAVALASEAKEPGAASAGLLMHWAWMGERHVQLRWQLGDRAGAIDMRLGTEPDAPAPPRDG
jgi:hypothetical protein